LPEPGVDHSRRRVGRPMDGRGTDGRVIAVEGSRRFRLEHGLTAAAAFLLVVLIVLPVLFLVFSSLAESGGPTLRHFARAFTSPLYVLALLHSLELGAWTALFSVLIGVPLAWAVSRTDLPGKPFVRLTATIAYLSPPFLLAIAYVNLFSPRAGIVNAFLRDVAGLPSLT